MPTLVALDFVVDFASVAADLLARFGLAAVVNVSFAMDEVVALGLAGVFIC